MFAADFNARSAIGDRSGSAAESGGADRAAGAAALWGRGSAVPGCVSPRRPETTMPPNAATMTVPMSTNTFCLADMKSLDFEATRLRGRFRYDDRENAVGEISRDGVGDD